MVVVVVVVVAVVELLLLLFDCWMILELTIAVDVSSAMVPWLESL